MDADRARGAAVENGVARSAPASRPLPAGGSSRSRARVTRFCSGAGGMAAVGAVGTFAGDSACTQVAVSPGA
jgi:hypothetical protein